MLKCFTFLRTVKNMFNNIIYYYNRKTLPWSQQRQWGQTVLGYCYETWVPVQNHGFNCSVIKAKSYSLNLPCIHTSKMCCGTEMRQCVLNHLIDDVREATCKRSSVYTGYQTTRFKFKLHHILAIWPRTNHWASL